MTEFYHRLVQKISGSSRICYSAGEQSYSYTDLWAAMTRLHGMLPNVKNAPVAVYAGKCFENYAAVYSILLSGNCWVPLEPAHPPQRLIEMIQLCKPAAILTDRKLPAEVAEFALASDISSFSMDTEAEPKEFDIASIDPDNWAYIMFTSGSTGTPKGVPMTHRNYINFVENALEILPLETGDVFADYHDFGFDLSIVYLFTCPLVEGTFAPALSEADRVLPVKHLQREEVSVLITVPSLLSRLRTYARGRSIDCRLRLLFFAGEPFRLDQLVFAYEGLGPEVVFNFYGLTETGVENFYHVCSPSDVEEFAEEGVVPIGKPLPGNRVRIGPGDELWLEGVQVTSGYLAGVGNDRFEKGGNLRWFKTGDQVSVRDGHYFCLGRLDSQVKVAGYRIELRDIESHLRAHPNVVEAVCCVRKHGEQEFIMAALTGDNLPDQQVLSRFLKDRLPSYMHPTGYRYFDDLPMNTSGKLDRQRIAVLLGEKKFVP